MVKNITQGGVTGMGGGLVSSGMGIKFLAGLYKRLGVQLENEVDQAFKNEVNTWAQEHEASKADVVNVEPEIDFTEDEVEIVSANKHAVPQKQQGRVG